ncbi:hypothetical protein Tco_0062909, partial [Tanacetum coccineum]
NCIPKHRVSLVEDFDSWNDYPWGEYMWDKFYKRTVNVVAIHRRHHLKEKKKNPDYNATYNLYGFAWAFKDSNPNLELYTTPAETRKAWFIASIEFINGLVDEDMNVSQDDLQHNSVSANSVLLANSHVLDSEGGAKKAKFDKDKQPTIAEVFAKVCALRKEVALVKVNDARIAKPERLFNDPMFLNVIQNGNQKYCQPRIMWFS